jgi:hypothetical protein
MDLHLHLGAHKTATTYMQSHFQQEAQLLRSEGIIYIPVEIFRPWRRQTLRRAAKKGPGSSTAYFDVFLERWRPRGSSTLVISDENMIGTCGNIVRFGRLYPELVTKLGGVAEMMCQRHPSIFISIRSYDAFYAAVYCEALRYDARCTFKNFSSRLDPTARRWHHILAEIATLFPESPIIVWPYEIFRDKIPEIFDRLSGKPITSKMLLSNENIHRSMSPRAVEIVESLAQRIGWGAARRLLSIVEFLLPNENGAPVFSPWSEQDRDFLRRLYEEDLAVIGANNRFRMLGLQNNR